MINKLTATGKYLSVASHANHINFQSNTTFTGIIRFNTFNQSLEVYDGNYWHSFNTTQHISLTFEAEKILDWADKKIKAEQARKELAEKNQAVRLALEKLEEAEAELDTVITLAQNYGTR